MIKLTDQQESVLRKFKRTEAKKHQKTDERHYIKEEKPKAELADKLRALNDKCNSLIRAGGLNHKGDA